MGTYDVESAKIKRQRMIADALRESGNEALPASIHTGGRFDAPVSPWQYASKALQQVLGAVNERQADKAEAKLSQQDKAQLAEVMQAQAAAQPDDAPTGDLDPVPVLPGPTKAERQQKALAAAMRGQQFGGSAAPFSDEIVKQQLFPSEYTIGADDTRMRGGAPIAYGLPRTVNQPADDRALVPFEASTIPDATQEELSAGRALRARNAFKPGMVPYEKPNAPTAGTLPLTPAQDKQAKQLGHAIYMYEKAPLSLTRNNPLNSAAMEYAIQEGEQAGEPYREYEYPARSAALNEYNRGVRGRTVTAFNTMLEHLATLREAGAKLKNGESLDWNKIGNWVTNRTGQKGLAGFETLRHNISGEIVKAVTGTAGAESDRMHALADSLSSASPENFEDILSDVEKLGVGQLRSQQQHFTATTGLGDARFRARLSPRAQTLYDASSASSDTPPAADAPVIKEIGGKKYRKTGPNPTDWEEMTGG